MQFARVKPRASAEVAFTIDGRPARARVGDTLMTAMLLNAPALRRFEFGEGARGGFCLMGACQDCFVALVDQHGPQPGAGERRARAHARRSRPDHDDARLRHRRPP
ncbi:MAG: 2Fe-2S iron-sulfur cluster-binding protein [Alphaproteobacteria bacterium]